MLKAVLIGAGQIGSRHLQGLSDSKFLNIIDVVDPSAEALAMAKVRWTEVYKESKNIVVNFHQNMDKLSNEYEVAIIATCSRHRLKALESLTLKRNIKSIILEKFLFTQLSEYKLSMSLIKERKSSVWVNCPNRLMPIYKKIKGLNSGGKLFYSVQGREYGLACNSIHYFDLLSFLMEDSPMSISGALLGDKGSSSKREEYLEYYGSLTGLTSQGSQMVVSCMQGGDYNVTHFITAKTFQATYDEVTGLFRFNTGTGWKEETHNLLYQSELSGLVVDQLIKTNSCELPTFEHSSRIHKSILHTLLKHEHGIGFDENTICPIT